MEWNCKTQCFTSTEILITGLKYHHEWQLEIYHGTVIPINVAINWVRRHWKSNPKKQLFSPENREKNEMEKMYTLLFPQICMFCKKLRKCYNSVLQIRIFLLYRNCSPAKAILKIHWDLRGLWRGLGPNPKKL